MDKTYVVQWKSKINGRCGIGTILFDQDEAESLVKELNRDFPDIDHYSLDTKNPDQRAIPLPIPVEHPT
jgi:hypothetical protein